MTNRPKQIGTAAETAVLRVARSHGFPHAERKVLAGERDVGDLWLLPSDAQRQVIVEVKGGHAAEQASDGQIAAWWTEAGREAWNAASAAAAGVVPVLVTKRKGVGAINAGSWWAHVDLANLDVLRHGATRTAGDTFPGSATMVRLAWGDLLSIIARGRWVG